MNLLDRPQIIHIVGIKGVGMTALAQWLKSRGHRVSGSDTADRFFTDQVLLDHGIPVVEGFAAANVPANATAVLFSTAYQPGHPEIAAAKQRGIPLYSYPEALGELFKTGEGIAVAGSHGKTTTTAMIGSIFQAANMDPTVIVGSCVPAFNGNARIGASPWLVIETDEYQDKLQHYQPKHVVLTNVEFDHPDFFPDPTAYREVFFRFLERLPENGKLITNADDSESVAVVSTIPHAAITFGVNQRADYRIEHETWDSMQNFTITHGAEQQQFRIKLPGHHNVMNAAAAAACSHALGVPWKPIARALETFTGTKRRFEYRGRANGCVLIDDYAHHPTEVAAAIQSAKTAFPGKRIVAVFQPHTYSRTKALLNEFAQALMADEVVLLDVYASARETEPTVSSQDLLRLLPRSIPSSVCRNVAEAADRLWGKIGPNDVVLLMGAGDVGQIADALLNQNSRNV